MPFQMLFIDDANQEEYLSQVLTWLEKDFEEQDSPEGSFWHNQGIIADAFGKGEAMVALSQHGRVANRTKNGR